jgi:3-methyladenine DNA glycosylase AlkD
MKSKDTIVEDLRKEFSKYRDKKYMMDAGQFEKGVGKGKVFALKTGIVRKISAQQFRKIKDRPKYEIFEYCEALLEEGYRGVAFDWAFRCRKQYEKNDFKLFESWLKKYVKGWGSCDNLCTSSFGHFIHQFPEYVPKTKKWTKSKNRWLRRASAVILIYPVSQKEMLSSVFEIADTLLMDTDDMVQKGYGWMLKEASNQYPNEVFQYVMKHRHEMPRTALRYAIEKYPPELRKKAMER